MHDASIPDIDHAIGSCGEGGAVRDDQDGSAARAVFDEAIDDKLLGSRINLGGRLIAQQDRRFCRERDG
jgi:hypothetical protein